MISHIVALSGGKDSTAMALRLREMNPSVPYEFVCTPTGDELPEMVAHWAKLQDLLGQRLTVISSGQSLQSLITRWNSLPNFRQRWCTRVLKIEPYERYLVSKLPAVSYVGIRADEADREGAEFGAQIETRFPLVEWGWGLHEVLDYLDSRGVTIPARTDCAMCFFQQAYEWFALWRDHPDRYAQAEALEAQTGHTFRSPTAKLGNWPASLANLRNEFESGREPHFRRMGDRPLMCGTCKR